MRDGREGSDPCPLWGVVLRGLNKTPPLPPLSHGSTTRLEETIGSRADDGGVVMEQLIHFTQNS